MKKILKIALGIEYDGTEFYGWQKQKKLRNVQYYLENAISKVANQVIEVFCAGRTDTGVHATGQVIHFETTTFRKEKAWIYGINANLPNDIKVLWVKKVPSKFHARFSAIARQYLYIIYNYKIRPVIFLNGITHIHFPLDIKKMQIASQYLIGENDFSSFRSSYCQSITPWRNIIHLNIKRYKNYVILDIKANSFLYRMVRIIVGSLIEVGSGNKQIDWIRNLLLSKNRIIGGPTAKAKGLYLFSVEYPKYFNLPNKKFKI